MSVKAFSIDFLSNEKEGMARVVCNELARLTYESTDEVFVSRLIKLRELSDAWSQYDNSLKSSTQPAAKVTTKTNKPDVERTMSTRRGPRVSYWNSDKQSVQQLKNGDAQQKEGSEDEDNDAVMDSDESQQTAENQQSNEQAESPSSAGATTVKAVVTPSIVCPSCPRRFRFAGNLERHREREHGHLSQFASTPGRVGVKAERGPFTNGVSCQQCSRKFYYKGCLRKHLEQHHGLKKPTNESVMSKWLHLDPEIAQDVAQMTSFHCTECDRTFSNLNALCWHVRVHYVRAQKYTLAQSNANDSVSEEPTYSFKCPVCERPFITEAEYNTHLADNVDSHECPDCFRRIESAFYLRVHQMTHHTRAEQHNAKAKHEPSTCPICGRTMRNMSSLHEHISAVHTAVKKYVCHVCAKQCARRSQLTRHMLTHGGERRFECGKCGRRFLLRDMMRRHMRAVHARIRPHLCNLCGRPFAEKHQLNTHMKVHRC